MPQGRSQKGTVIPLPWVKLDEGKRAAAGLPSESAEGSGPRRLTPSRKPYDRLFSKLDGHLQDGEQFAIQDREQAPLLYAELLAKPSKERLELVRGGDRFASYLLCEMLLEGSRECWFGSQQKAAELARLALAVAENLDEDRFGETLCRNLRVRCWAYRANAARIGGDYRQAEEAFQKAEAIAESTVLDPAEKIELLSLKVSLFRPLGRYRDMLLLLDEMAVLNTSLGDEHQLGRTLIQRAIALREMGNSEAALQAIRRGTALIEPRRDPNLMFSARHNLLLLLLDFSRISEAKTEIGALRAICEATGDEPNLVRMRWTEGLIAMHERRDEAATELFTESRDRFLELGLYHEALLVTIDQAALYVRRGQTARVREVSTSLMTLFKQHQLGREAMAAMLLFRYAAEQEIATVGLIQELAGFIKRSQQPPARRD